MLNKNKLSAYQKPLLIVISAPSGAGKSTLCDMLLQKLDNIVYSVSCTTRPPRGAEVDGEDYIFMTDEGFQQRIDNKEFLEYAEVHGHRYGTLKSVVDSAMAEGQHVLMDIDVQGARNIRKIISELPEDDPKRRGFVDIFIMPPSLETLKERIEKRGEDDRESINMRMKNAEKEILCKNEFRYVVVNDDLEKAFKELYGIIESEAQHA